MRALRAASVLTLLSAVPALAAPTQLCRPGQTDAAPKPLPPSLVGAARAGFGYTRMPAAMVARMTVFRCADGRPMMCSTGANLPCGKADTAASLPAVSQYCSANPDMGFVPAYVTGHDTLYQWHCAGGRAVAANPAPRDAQGYFADYWKAAGP